mmetsp:Transcript_29779/g.44799  ORF Transcript_29779/g.44799 Transcript_29779/m.44799 type:complete len:157 (-) Transcript_29779:450-920(-)
MFHDSLIEITSSQVCISIGGQDLKDPIINSQKSNIKCPPTQIKHQNILFFLLFPLLHCLFDPIRNRRSSGLINNPFHMQPGNNPRITSRMTLCIIKICRHGNYRPINWFTQILFRISFQFAQDHGANLFRCIGVFCFFVADDNVGTIIFIGNSVRE